MLLANEEKTKNSDAYGDDDNDDAFGYDDDGDDDDVDGDWIGDGDAFYDDDDNKDDEDGALVMMVTKGSTVFVGDDRVEGAWWCGSIIIVAG